MKLIKSIALGFVLLLIIVSNTSAQAVYDISGLALINPNNYGVGLTWGQSTATCVQIFGQPSNTSTYHSETDDVTITVYSYGNNKIEFSDDKMVGYELTEPSIRVGTPNSQTFKIGDAMTVETVQIPRHIGPGMPIQYTTETRYNFLNFPLSKGAGQTRGKSFKSASIVYVKNGSTQLDYRFELLFNSNNQLFSISLLN